MKYINKILDSRFSEIEHITTKIELDHFDGF